MKIEFSTEAANKACTELEENTVLIEHNRELLISCNQRMRGVWKGGLADSVIRSLESNHSFLELVEKYVRYLNEHITICRKNYDITEKTNIRIVKSIDDMFRK